MSTTQTVTIRCSVLPWQARVMREAARFNVVDIGRRAGKTHLAQILVSQTATAGAPAAYLAPTYKMMLDVWRTLRDNLAPVAARISVSERRIDVRGGGTIELWSMERADAVRGRRYARMVVDEAAHVPGLMDAWHAVLRPTLADLRGDAWFPSTPLGRNDFWTLFRWGMDPTKTEWRAWQMPSSVGPLTGAEIEAMRATMPERAFAQEILAEFLEDSGAVFRGVTAAAKAQEQERAIDGHTYVVGVDWGKSDDFTAMAVVDSTLGELVALDRSNHVDYAVQRGRLASLCERFSPVAVIAEANAMGEPIIESLQRAGMPVYPFTTTNATKAAIIDSLSLAFERGTVRIIADPVLLGELQSYTSERLPSGLTRYTAPSGMHDDCVMALALAHWYGARAENVTVTSLLGD